MSAHFGSSGSPRSEILEHLRTLRSNIAQARNALMHYRTDRLDRDKLEPAARRVDRLMEIYSGAAQDPVQGSVWIIEIQSGVELVTNPKAAEPLREAQLEIDALLVAMRTTGDKSVGPPNR
jgi:hypothetical protein